MNNKIIEHPSCHSVDNLNKPQIETVSIPKGTTGCLELNHNEVAFFLEGRLKFIFGNFHEHESKFYFSLLENDIFIAHRLMLSSWSSGCMVR